MGAAQSVVKCSESVVKVNFYTLLYICFYY